MLIHFQHDSIIAIQSQIERDVGREFEKSSELL